MELYEPRSRRPTWSGLTSEVRSEVVTILARLLLLVTREVDDGEQTDG